jgi:hypothetical protein
MDLDVGLVQPEPELIDIPLQMRLAERVVGPIKPTLGNGQTLSTPFVCAIPFANYLSL